MQELHINESRQLDTISIQGIRVEGKYGVSDAERAQLLPIDISVALKVDLRAAALSDNIADTVDYSHIRKVIVELVGKGSRCLLETLAQDILDALFLDERIKQASVSVSKPQRLKGATPTVTMTKTR